MAGSIGHVTGDDGRIFTGISLLENASDMAEAVEEFAYVLLATTTPEQRAEALKAYYACCRGERPWPHWWRPDYRPDGDHLPPQRRRNPA
jgi:hypothetical protein